MEKPICETCKKEIKHSPLKSKAFNWFSEKYAKRKFVEAVKIWECDCPNVIIDSQMGTIPFETKTKLDNVVKLYNSKK